MIMPGLRAAAAGLFALLTLTACGTTGLPALPNSGETAAYTLDTGDKLRIAVFGQEQLTGEYGINDKGELSMPLIGAVAARGRTIAGLEQLLKQRLAQGILVDPSVSVQIAAYRPFFILGEVSRPGQYPYVENMTVLTAAAIAGGFTFRAEQNTVSITRVTEGRSQEFKADRDALVRPGDTVFVHERFF